MSSISSPNAVHPSEWSLQQVVAWLQTLQPVSIVQQHANSFREQGIEGDVLLHLDADSLREIGVTSIGHRLVLLRSIYDLKRRWNVEIEADDWRPDIATVELKSGSGSGSGGGSNSSLHAYGRANVTNNDMLKALYERDERVWALEDQVARLVEWLMRYTDPAPGARPVEVLQPYWPPARTYGRDVQQTDGTGRLRSATNELDPALRGNRTPQTAVLRSLHGTDTAHSPYNAPNSATLTNFSPASTPSATPTATNAPLSFSESLLSKSSQSTLVGGGGGLSSNGSDPSLSSHNSYNKNGLTAGAAPNLSPSSPLSISGLAPDSRSRDRGAQNGTGSGGSTGDGPYKSFRVTLDDPCFKVLPAALKKYKIDDDWRQYALFICYGNTERCLSYDEKPLLLFQKLKENKQNPVFMLRHIRDVKSPITIANAKAAARKAADAKGNVPASPASQRSGVGKVADAVAKFSGASGKEGVAERDVTNVLDKPDAAVLNSLPGQPVLSGPASQLGKGKVTESSRGSATAASVSGLDTYAIAIYPYASEREDEFDVAVGDTFIVKSKVKGWWVVQRDGRANGQPIIDSVLYGPDGSPRNGGEIKSGWVPAGCLLETRQPLSTIVHVPSEEFNTPNTSPTSPRTPQAASRMEDAQRLGAPGSKENRLKVMSTIPIPPSSITSTSTPGILLMDYSNPSENLHLKKDQRLRVFKRYNHWSYCVEEGGRNTRAWLPSWYIGKVAGSSSRSAGHAGSASSSSHAGSQSRIAGLSPSKHPSTYASPIRSPLGGQPLRPEL